MLAPPVSRSRKLVVRIAMGGSRSVERTVSFVVVDTHFETVAAPDACFASVIAVVPHFVVHRDCQIAESGVVVRHVVLVPAVASIAVPSSRHLARASLRT